MYSLIASIIFLFSVLIYLIMSNNTEVIVMPQRPLPPPSIPTRAPEFRGPPIKQYKPKRFQQMGLLLGDDGDTRPLYGRESRTHRDRYHYYTTTGGEQIYSLPISFDGRDCSEDIGCPEFYGNESVSVTGSDGTYSTNIYRTENFPQFY